MPQVDDLLRYLRGGPLGPSCASCGGVEHLIVGDGPPCCRVCILRWGRAAMEPARLPVTIASELVAMHGDVVTLVRVLLPFDHVGWTWIWTADWPGPEPTDATVRRLRAIASERPSLD